MSIFKVINPGDNPNEGRVKINYNFDLLGSLSGGGYGEIIIGAPITGGSTTEVLYTDNYGNLYSDAGFTRDSVNYQTKIWNDYDSNNSIGLSIGGHVPAAIFTVNDTINDFTNSIYAINEPPDTPNSSILFFKNNNTGDISLVSATQNNGGNPLSFMESALNSGEFSNIKVYSSGITLNVSGTPFNLMSKDGTSGQSIVTDGNGNLSFENIEISPGGENGNIQFNDNGSFNGVSAFTFNKLTNQFNVGQGNMIDYSSYGSSIIGGGFLSASIEYGSVISGHSICNSFSSSIIGGGSFYGGIVNFPNKIYDSSSVIIQGSLKSIACYSNAVGIFSSVDSKFYQSNSSTILGSNNSYLNNSRQSSIMNGGISYIYDSQNSVILSGKYNTLNSSLNSAIIGGNNLILSNENNTVLMQNMRANVISGHTFYSGSTSLETIINDITEQHATINETKVISQYTALTTAATYTFDVSQNRTAKITLQDNSNLNLILTNFASGNTGNIILKQGLLGDSTLTLTGASYNNYVVNGGSGVINLTQASNAVDIISFLTDGTNVYWSSGFNYL